MIEALVIAVIVIQVVLLFVLLRRPSSTSKEEVIQHDLSKLGESVEKLRENLSDKLSERLDKNQDMMLRSLQKQFSQSSKLITEVTQNLTEIKESNKQVIGVTDELKTIQNILQNPKQRGVLGEYYLETLLGNVLPPERFTMQYAFKNGDIVDAVITLEKNKILPIDSKFSLENYNRLIEEKSKSERSRLAKEFKNDLKKRIDETAKYIRPEEGTLDHAFMFIPSEAIYYDLLANQVGSTDVAARDLVEYAFREKHVVIVSPTTFLAYLQTVIQGLRSLQIEQQAKEIQKRVGELGRHLSVYEDYMQRLGKSLGTTVNHYNNAHKELGKIDKDVIRITEKAGADIEPLSVEKPSLED